MSKITVPVVNFQGKSLSPVQGSEAVFGVQPNEAVVHFACEGQRFAFYNRTACTKVRSAVSGGGKKIRQQKGSGGARQGGNRAPHWVGGGVVFGPSAILRDFKVNRKVRKAAILSVLSDRYSSGQLRVLSGALEKPNSSAIASLINSLSLSKARVGFVVSDSVDSNLVKSARNLKNVDVWTESRWTCLDFIKSDTLIFSESAFNSLIRKLEVTA